MNDTGLTGRARDLTLGARFALSGGREGWLRTVLTAIGVGLGVALLLLATALPHMLSSRETRSLAREGAWGSSSKLPHAADDTLLIEGADTEYHGLSIRGRLLRADGIKAPAPPGVRHLPGPGEMVVSPALAKLLASDDGRLLRDRLDYRSVGTIGAQGLVGPSELTYYAGSDRLSTAGGAERADRYGITDGSPPMDTVLIVLIIMTCVVLLVPVTVFVATAVRFGGERRDRRLAALRLVGADRRMTRWIAAGEALCGSLLGLAVGTALFLLLRQLAPRVSFQGASVFAADLDPGAGFAGLIALTVPASAVLITLVALRGVAIEPLGVVRNAAGRQRRMWWRLLAPVIGLALLAPLSGKVNKATSVENYPIYQVATGSILLLIGVTALLPWLVEASVARLRGGPLPWQLATRRLQLNSGAATRAVSGITVAVAGAIALQMLFTGVQSDYEKATGQDPRRAQVQGTIPATTGGAARSYVEKFRTTPGVQAVVGLIDAYATKAGTSDEVTAITIGDCPTLRELARISSCKDGDVFVADNPSGGLTDTSRRFPPGTKLVVEEYESASGAAPRTLRWTVPSSAHAVQTRPDPTGERHDGVLATPSAVDARNLPNATTEVMLRLDRSDPDSLERVRNTAAHIDPAMYIRTMLSTKTDSNYAAIENGLLIGAIAILVLIGASMIVSTLEQLRERRRLLSVLVAFGTRRTTLGWSVLWQTAIPVVLGLALSVAGGLALGYVMLKLVSASVKDWLAFVPIVGAGAAVIALVTLASLPPLWHMMRPDGLRTE